MTDPKPRPVAEVIPLGHSPSVRLEWASVEAAHNAKPGPLYDQAALDAAVAAERERWALAFDAMREKALAEQAGPSGDLANIMLRQVAELGFGECARAIRAVGNEA
jgi:hypothetical protein